MVWNSRVSDPKGEFDIAGIGRVAEAIPKEGWKKAIDTACDTFSDLIAPITKTTAGLGGLIQAKFDTMIDVQKVFAADAVYRARQKSMRTKRRSNSRPSARVLVKAIEEASVESDDDLRDIWSNLIANEMLGSGIHPEFPRILARLSAQDAVILSAVAERSSDNSIKRYAKSLGASVRIFGIPLSTVLGENTDANHEHLERLGLIERRDRLWYLTHFGEEFVAAVTEPSLTIEKIAD
jgi:hypothetical protein